MKIFLVLLLSLNLVFGQPANKNVKNYEKLVLENSEICVNCQKNYEDLHEAFQDPFIKFLFLYEAEKHCTTEECFEKMRELINSITEETDPKRGCAPVCDTQEKKEFKLILNLINKSKLPKKLNYHSFLSKNVSLTDNMGINCNECLNQFTDLHEAFQDPIIRLLFLYEAEKHCTTEECFEKMRKLIKSITEETDPKKGCAPVCDTQEKKVFFNF